MFNLNVAKIYYKKQKKLFLGDINTKIDWGYARDYVEAAYNLTQLYLSMIIM